MQHIIFNLITSLSLQTWDTESQNQYHCLVPMFFHGETTAIVVYLVADKCLFESVDFWSQRLKDHEDPKMIKFLVWNKADFDKKKEIAAEEGRKRKIQIMQFFVKSALRLD
jgi:GTPase SAR1 family protein